MWCRRPIRPLGRGGPERRCPTSDVCLVHGWGARHRRRRSAAAASGRSSRGLALRRHRQGCRRPEVPRKTRRAAGRPPMARTESPLTPGSRHQGSVGDHPRYGGRAAYPPAPSDSPTLGTHEGARRPALYGDTSARLAAAPYAPFLANVPHVGDNPTPIGNERHPAFYTQREPKDSPP